MGEVFMVFLCSALVLLLLTAMFQRRYRKLQSAAMAVLVGIIIVAGSTIIIYDFPPRDLARTALILVVVLWLYALVRTSPPYIKPGTFWEKK